MPATTTATTSKKTATAAVPKTPKVEMTAAVAAAAPDAPKKASKAKKGEKEKKEEENVTGGKKIDFGSDDEMEPESAAAASAVTPASDGEGASEKKKAGRPKGSKNKPKADAEPATEKVKKPRATKKAASDAAAAPADAADTSATDHSSDDEGTVAAAISDIEEDEPKKTPKKRLTKAQKEANAAIEAALAKFEAEQEAANAAFRATLGLPPRIVPTSAVVASATNAGKPTKKPRAPSVRKPISIPAELAGHFQNLGIVAFKTATNTVVVIHSGYAPEGYHSISAVVTHESADVATVEDYLTGDSLDEIPVLGPNECLKVIDADGVVTYRDAEDEEIAPANVLTEVTGSYFDNVPEKDADKEKFYNFRNALYNTGFFSTHDVFALLNFIVAQMRAEYPDESRSTIEVEKKNRKGETEMAASGHHFRIYGAKYVAFFEYVRQTIIAAAATGDAKTLEKIANMRSRTVTRVPTKKASEKAAEKGLPAPEAHEEYVEGAFEAGDSFDFNENIPLTFIMQFKPFLLNSSHDEDEAGAAMEMEESA